jgi:hypothetical protein
VLQQTPSAITPDVHSSPDTALSPFAFFAKHAPDAQYVPAWHSPSEMHVVAHDVGSLQAFGAQDFGVVVQEPEPSHE